MSEISIIELEKIVNDCRDVIITLLDHLVIAGNHTFDIVIKTDYVVCYIGESLNLIEIDTKLNVYTNFLDDIDDIRIESILKRNYNIKNILND